MYSLTRVWIARQLASTQIGVRKVESSTKRTEIPSLMQFTFPVDMQRWLWLAFFASFAVKVPMWPVHTWLPDAHVEAPTAGSVILAAVLLKMGAYGFLRFSVPMLPYASVYFTPLMMATTLRV